MTGWERCAPIDDIDWWEMTFAEEGARGLLATLEELTKREGLREDTRLLSLLFLLREAVMREKDWWSAHPLTVFQSLWNLCWWYDHPDAAVWYAEPKDGWSSAGPPWRDQTGPKLHELASRWREQKRERMPDFPWFRSLRPPELPLGCGPDVSLSLPREDHIFQVSLEADDVSVTIERSQHSLWELRRDAEQLPDFPAVRECIHLQTGESKTSPSKGRRACEEARGRGEAVTHPALAIVDPETKTELLKIDIKGLFDDEMCVCGAHFSPDGRWLVVEGWIWDYDGVFAIYEMTWPDNPNKKPKCRLKYRREISTYPSAVGFSSNNRYAGFLVEGKVSLFDMESGGWVWRDALLQGSTLDFAISSDGQKLIRVSSEKKLELWPIERLGQRPVRIDDTMAIGYTAFSPNGERLYTRPLLWDGKSGKLIRQLEDNVRGYLEGGPPTFSHHINDQHVVRVEGGICRWRVEDGVEEGESEGFFFSRTLVCHSFDGSMLAIYENEELQLINASDGQVLRRWKPEQKPPERLGEPVLLMSRDNRYLLWNTRDHNVAVYDIEQQRVTHAFTGHTALVTDMVLSLDDQLVVSAGFGESLRMWELSSGNEKTSRPLDEREPVCSVGNTNEAGEFIYKEHYQWKKTPAAVAALHDWEGFQSLSVELPWSIVHKDGVFCIQFARQDGSEPIKTAWFPVKWALEMHPSGRIWANDNVHFVLEGDPLTLPRADIARMQAKQLEEALFFES